MAPAAAAYPSARSVRFTSFTFHFVIVRPFAERVLTVFVEGSVHEREALSGSRAVLPIEQAIAEHPMVKHYGCPPAAMDLVRAHRAVEGGHRKDAWRMVLDCASGHERAIVDAVGRAHRLWLEYRDGVCRAAQDAGGTMEYCRGVGWQLAHLMEREHGQASLELLRRVKTALDPSGILNPGKVAL